MLIFKIATDLTTYILAQQKIGNTIGFVPTMGALHQGHISLIEQSKKENNLTVCSIFVNPTQFNNIVDFEKYPITLDADVELLESKDCDILFLPTVNEIYPNGTSSLQQYNLGFIETILDGKYRQGHFQGVCQVVHKLLQIVPAQYLYLGQKDFQQCMVIQKMIEITQLNTQIKICSTLREPSSLAMSSRNMRLSSSEKLQAVKISEALLFIKKEIKIGELSTIKKRVFQYLTDEGFKVDYVEIANANNLLLQENWDGKTQLVALIAAFLNDVRLIDNMVLN